MMMCWQNRDMMLTKNWKVSRLHTYICLLCPTSVELNACLYKCIDTVQVSTWMFNLKFKGLCAYPYILPNTSESMVSYHPHGVATFRDLHPAPHFQFRNMPWASWHNEMCRNSHDKCGSCQLKIGASLPCSVEGGGPYNLHADLVDRRFLESLVISFCNFCNDHVFRHSLNHPELVQDFGHEQYVSNLLYSIVVAPKECQGNVLPIWSLQIMNKAEDCSMVFQAIASPPLPQTVGFV